MSDLRGHSMYIATRRARLEAREAGFLVLNIFLRKFFGLVFWLVKMIDAKGIGVAQSIWS